MALAHFLKKEAKVLREQAGGDWPSTGTNQKEYKDGVSKMAQPLKALAAKPDNLRSIPRIYIVERDNQLL